MMFGTDHAASFLNMYVCGPAVLVMICFTFTGPAAPIVIAIIIRKLPVRTEQTGIGPTADRADRRLIQT